jgi:hypothetical protein
MASCFYFTILVYYCIVLVARAIFSTRATLSSTSCILVLRTKERRSFAIPRIRLLELPQATDHGRFERPAMHGAYE